MIRIFHKIRHHNVEKIPKAPVEFDVTNTYSLEEEEDELSNAGRLERVTHKASSARRGGCDQQLQGAVSEDGKDDDTLRVKQSRLVELRTQRFEHTPQFSNEADQNSFSKSCLPDPRKTAHKLWCKSGSESHDDECIIFEYNNNTFSNRKKEMIKSDRIMIESSFAAAHLFQEEKTDDTNISILDLSRETTLTEDTLETEKSPRKGRMSRKFLKNYIGRKNDTSDSKKAHQKQSDHLSLKNRRSSHADDNDRSTPNCSGKLPQKYGSMKWRPRPRRNKDSKDQQPKNETQKQDSPISSPSHSCSSIQVQEICNVPYVQQHQEIDKTGHSCRSEGKSVFNIKWEKKQKNHSQNENSDAVSACGSQSAFSVFSAASRISSASSRIATMLPFKKKAQYYSNEPDIDNLNDSLSVISASEASLDSLAREQNPFYRIGSKGLSSGNYDLKTAGPPPAILGAVPMYNLDVVTGEIDHIMHNHRKTNENSRQPTDFMSSVSLSSKSSKGSRDSKNSKLRRLVKGRGSIKGNESVASSRSNDRSHTGSTDAHHLLKRLLSSDSDVKSVSDASTSSSIRLRKYLSTLKRKGNRKVESTKNDRSSPVEPFGIMMYKKPKTHRSSSRRKKKKAQDKSVLNKENVSNELDVFDEFENLDEVDSEDPLDITPKKKSKNHFKTSSSPANIIDPRDMELLVIQHDKKNGKQSKVKETGSIASQSTCSTLTTPSAVAETDRYSIYEKPKAHVPAKRREDNSANANAHPYPLRMRDGYIEYSLSSDHSTGSRSSNSSRSSRKSLKSAASKILTTLRSKQNKSEQSTSGGAYAIPANIRVKKERSVSILLTQSALKIFEIVSVDVDRLTSVEETIKRAREIAVDGRLASQTYIGLCNDKREINDLALPITKLVDWEEENEKKRQQVQAHRRTNEEMKKTMERILLVAVPQGSNAKDCQRIRRVLWRNPRLQKWWKQTDPFRPTNPQNPW